MHLLINSRLTGDPRNGKANPAHHSAEPVANSHLTDLEKPDTIASFFSLTTMHAMPDTDSLITKSKTANRLLALLVLQLFATSALALPSFARQTGEACTACHIQAFGVSLTPRGRDFKLKGYAEGDASRLPALSVTAHGGGVFDISDYKDSLFGNLKRETSRSTFNGSVFYAGKIVQDHLGAYVQGSYTLDPESGADLGFLDKVDLRFASQADLAGHSLEYGISVNNEPGVQDLWNTNPVWGNQSVHIISLPSHASIYPTPLADRGLSGQVAGASLYTLVNKLLYVEAGGYASLPGDVQKGIGRSNNYGYNDINGSAAYWRIALQHQWGGHYWSVGHFGLKADVGQKLYNNISIFGGALLVPPPVAYSDLGLDATYQYIANPDHIVEFKGRYVRESRPVEQVFSAVGGMAFSPKKYEITTESFEMDSSYTWHQTLGLSVGYQQYSLPDTTLGSGFGYAPTTKGFAIRFLTPELSYTPFGKQQSLAAPWLNLRFSLKYLANLSNDRFSKAGLLPSDILYFNGQLAF